jgi:hypothetical protein
MRTNRNKKGFTITTTGCKGTPVTPFSCGWYATKEAAQARISEEERTFGFIPSDTRIDEVGANWID